MGVPLYSRFARPPRPKGLGPCRDWAKVGVEALLYCPQGLATAGEDSELVDFGPVDFGPVDFGPVAVLGPWILGPWILGLWISGLWLSGCGFRGTVLKKMAEKRL